MSHQYPITYTVVASTEFEAITQAVEKLRTGVRVIGSPKAHRVSGTLWRVTLDVSEDD